MTLIAHLSDPHLSLSRPHKQEALRQAVAHLLAFPMRPDAVLVSGDIADNGRPEDYALFKALIQPLGLPVYVIPGNHDDRAEMLRVFGVQGTSPLPEFMQYVADVGAVRLVALDTHIPGQSGGLLDAARLQWLNDRLSEAPARPTLVFLHHPPLVAGLQVMDSIGLEGTRGLRDVLLGHPQVTRLLAGHTHMAQTQGFAGTLLTVAPGLDASLLPDLGQPHKLVAQKQPPLCLLHHWTPETGMLTYTSVIGKYALETLHDGTQWV